MVFLAWVFFTTLVVFVAVKLKRRGWLWFIISIFISPLGAGFILLSIEMITRMVKDNKKQD